jgi:hypothetical protein
MRRTREGGLSIKSSVAAFRYKGRVVCLTVVALPSITPTGALEGLQQVSKSGSVGEACSIENH